MSRVHRRPLDSAAPAEDILAELVAAADVLDAPPASRWAVAVPGPFDYQRGVALYVGVGKFDSLRGVDLAAALTDRLRNRPGAVGFVNDASAFALGEWRIGAAHGTSSLLAITLGTGIGSAFLRDGRIVDSGPGVPPQAEVHLLRHDGLPLEDWVSRRAIRARYDELVGSHTGSDVHEIAAAARAGEAAARQVLDEAFTVLGQVLRPWAIGFGAELVLVGGAVSGAWDVIAEPLGRGLSDSGARVPLRRAGQGERAGLVGAACALVSA